MFWKKNAYRASLLIGLGAAVVSLYGCGSINFGVDHDKDKPPYYHGHVEKEPPASHSKTHTHEAHPPAPAPAAAPGDMLIADGAWPTNDKDCCSVIHAETVGPKNGYIGQPYCYTIKVTNLTKRAVKNVEITQSLPKNFQVKSSEPQSKSVSEGTGKWFLGDFGPQEVKNIKVCGVPTQSGGMPFCTDVAYKLPELCIEPIILEPKLSITKRAPAEVMLCSPITYTFTVKNAGTGIANNVSVKESLPAGLKTMDGKSDVVLNVGSLKAGESKDVAITVQADKQGKYTNVASVSADGGLSSESNQTVTDVKQPVLAIEKAGPDKIYLGRNITYDVTVTNKGTGVAASTVVEDTLPAGAVIAKAEGGVVAGNKITWNLGDLQPDNSKKVSVTVNPKGLGSIKNVASAKANCATAVTTSATTNVLGIPAILLEVIDEPDPVAIGDDTTYIITVTNQGSEDSINIKINCILEAEMQYVSCSGVTNGSSPDGKSVVFAPLPSLAPKAKASWKVVIKALNPGDVRFKVNMIDDRLKRLVEETEATNFYK